MDVSTIPTQARAIFSQMTPGQKVTMVLFGVSVVALLVAVTVWGAKPALEQVTLALAPEEVESAKRSLAEAGINFQVEENKIRVKAGDAVRSKQLLMEQGVVTKEKIFDLDNYMAKVDPFTPLKTQDLLARQLLEGQIVRTIRSWKGVEKVQVTFPMAARDPMTVIIPSEKQGAFITIWMARGNDLNQKMAENIIRAVSASESSIAVDKVVLVDGNNTTRQYKILDGTQHGANAAALERKAEYENYYTEKIQNYLLKSGFQANVMVDVTIDASRKKFTEKYLTRGEEITTYKTSVTTSETKESEPDPGVTGMSRETLAPGTPGTGRTLEKSSSKTSDTKYEPFVPEGTRIKEGVSDLIKSINVSLMIHDRLVEEEKDGVKSIGAVSMEKETETFKNMVMNIIKGPVTSDPDEKRATGVEIAYFKNAFRPVQPPVVTTKENVRDFLQQYRYLLVAGLVLIALLMLFAMYRRALPLPEVEVVQEVGARAVTDAGVSFEPKSTVDPRLADMQNKIRRMVDRDAGRAASLLRRWMTKEQAEGSARGGGHAE